MKKKLIAIVLVLLICLSGGYYIAGLRSQSLLKKMIVDANVAVMHSLQAQNSPLEVKFRLVDYKNYLFSSSADVEASLKVQLPVNLQAKGANQGTMPSMQMPALTYRIPVAIEHGPFLFKERRIGLSYAKATLGIPEKYRGMLKQFLSKDSVEPKIKFTALSLYDGKTEFNVSMPPFHLDSQMMQGKVNWLGFENRWLANQNFTHMKGESVMSGLNFEMNGQSLDVESLSVNYDLNSVGAGVWLGKADFDLPKFNFEKLGQSVFSFDGGSMSSDSSQKDGLMKGNAQITLGQAVVMGRNYGPGQLESTMSNIDLASMMALQRQANQINRMGRLSQANQKKQLQTLMPDLFKLASKNPSFSIKKLQMKIPEGEVRAHGKITVLGRGKVFKQPEDLLSALDGKAALSAPKALVETILRSVIHQKLIKRQMDKEKERNMTSRSQVPNGVATDSALSGEPILSNKELRELAASQAGTQLNSLVKSGLVSIDGENYTVELALKNKELRVNGKVVQENVFQ